MNSQIKQSYELITDPIQSGKQINCCIIISLLRFGKATLVHSIVDVPEVIFRRGEK